MEKISLYIPVYNGSKYIAKTLEAVFLQTCPPDEVIVIDDGSTDATLEQVRRFPVKVVLLKKRCGLAAARNAGFKAAKYELVAALDADCVPNRKWLEYLIHAFRENNVAGVGGRLTEPNHKRSADAWRAVYLKQHYGKCEKEVPFIAGCNSLFRKKAVFDVGLYDESFITNHEDTDLSERIIAAGLKLKYIPSAQVIHIKRDSIMSVLKTCWHFRHRRVPQNKTELALCIIRDGIKGCLSLCSSVLFMRFRLLSVSFFYFFVQAYLSIKAFRMKTTQV